MTDNRTTWLREKLNKLIIDIERLDIMLDSPAYDMTLGEYEQELEKLLDKFMQAIAATLRSSTLTAEQVREAVEASTWAETSTIREFNDSSWQAIADELNARAERTCEQSRMFNLIKRECDGERYTWRAKEMPNYCPNCGRKVVGE